MPTLLSAIVDSLSGLTPGSNARVNCIIAINLQGYMLSSPEITRLAAGR